MNLLSRTSRNPIAKWWWTVDRQMVIGVMVLLGMGFFAAFAASPAVAQHIGKSTYYFANKQLVFSGACRLCFSRRVHARCHLDKALGCADARRRDWRRGADFVCRCHGERGQPLVAYIRRVHPAVGNAQAGLCRRRGMVAGAPARALQGA